MTTTCEKFFPNSPWKQFLSFSGPAHTPFCNAIRPFWALRITWEVAVNQGHFLGVWIWFCDALSCDTDAPCTTQRQRKLRCDKTGQPAQKHPQAKSAEMTEALGLGRKARARTCRPWSQSALCSMHSTGDHRPPPETASHCVRCRAGALGLPALCVRDRCSAFSGSQDTAANGHRSVGNKGRRTLSDRPFSFFFPFLHGFLVLLLFRSSLLSLRRMSRRQIRRLSEAKGTTPSSRPVRARRFVPCPKTSFGWSRSGLSCPSCPRCLSLFPPGV